MFQRARLVCLGCPVLAECRTYGIQLATLTGVAGMLGGLTPKELRRKAAQATGTWRKRAQHGTRARYVAPHRCRCAECKAANTAAERKRKAGTAA